jgi:hypothetical protein
MEILDDDWLTSQPIDYEFKKYKLLSAANKYQSLIKDGDIFPVLDEVEFHLDYLYKFKYKIDEITSRLRTLKGIDIDTMSLQYEYNNANTEEINTIISISEDATVFFEKIYKDIRAKWRDTEKFINFTQIPEQKRVYVNGYLILCTTDKKYRIYSFVKPGSILTNWKDFKFELFKDADDYSIEKISDFVTIVGINEPSRIHIRADIKKSFPLETCLLPITRYKLFNYLKTNT